ncbi:hypothetical protein DERF_003276 [Dermatophagoides farinae]|uniref:Uncharacterized protein n=1 Tax=Dermatophagoides farinae TaxID=6954 RepID=A0A922LBC7_DERFA|nr:hypothetical protein DERF_003276 [Dermatophagoides farinae]
MINVISHRNGRYKKKKEKKINRNQSILMTMCLSLLFLFFVCLFDESFINSFHLSWCLYVIALIYEINTSTTPEPQMFEHFGIFFLINLAHICLSKQLVLIVHIVIEDHDEEYHNRMVNIDLLDPVVCHHVCTNFASIPDGSYYLSTFNLWANIYIYYDDDSAGYRIN